MSAEPDDLPGTPSFSPSVPPSTSSSSSSSSSSGSPSEDGSYRAGSNSDGAEPVDDDDMVAMLEAEMDGSDGAEEADVAMEPADPPADSGAEEAWKPPQAPVMAVLKRPARPAGSSSPARSDSQEGPARRRRVLSRPSGNSAAPNEAPMPAVAPKPAALEPRGCPHPGYFAGMCVACGQPKPKADQAEGAEPSEEAPRDSSSLAMKYIHPELEVAKEEVERQREKRDEALLSSKKLVLVLDLDHTLLNSIKEKDLKDCQEELQKMLEAEKDGDEAAKTLYRLSHMGMWTKLRPPVREFIASAGKLFELYIYTMGNRDYAMQMASVLDPAGLYFRQRIISQNDSTEKHTKSLDIVPAKVNNALILDDTEAVWPQHRGNVVRIERYLFFPGSPSHFGLHAKALMDHKRDEDPEKGALAVTLRVLQDVHRLYFEAPDGQRDVRTALAEVKRRVLKGCRLVLSRAFQEQHPLAELAAELGAECSQGTHESATHVVAGSQGTDKVKWAQANNVAVVNPHWVEASALLWEKADEKNFQVKNEKYAIPRVVSQDQERKNALAAAAGG